ncbi:MAG: hypothetical protein FGM33_00740 [Candidatus Kapabacteria bacterium]|nr:hypothetical protein [Candidatus Kapabacteria bacterium]
MHVLTGIQNDHCHLLDGPGAYEWWYADALDATGQWGVVLILFRGMPMSPDYLADPRAMSGGYAVSIYHRGVRLAFGFGGFPLESCQFDADGVGVSMPCGGLKVGADGLTMSIDAPCGSDGRRVNVVLRMPEVRQPASALDEASDGHSWVLSAARAAAEVSLEISEEHGRVVHHQFEALAYHDHNLGTRAMSCDYRDWYWGRVQGAKQTYVYLFTRRSADNSTWFGRVLPDGRVERFEQVTVALNRPRITMFGLMHHRTIRLSGVDSTGQIHEVECHNDSVCEDGPFYQRYVSSWHTGDGELAYGMSEYMNARRLAEPWIRPFLRLPWVVSS